jgi:hypothetical protein
MRIVELKKVWPNIVQIFFDLLASIYDSYVRVVHKCHSPHYCLAHRKIEKNKMHPSSIFLENSSHFMYWEINYEHRFKILVITFLI